MKLSKTQLEEVIKGHILEKDGLSEVFSMMINGLMYSERELFLSSPEGVGNKGNGYRQIKRSGIGSQLELSIPRDRLGVFKPVVIGLLNEQEERIKELCFELYGKGLTTRQIEDVVEKIYGSHFSKSSISRITTDFSSLVESWINRELDAYYPVIYIDAIHLKVRRDTVSTEAFYVLLGVKEDYTREVLGIMNIPQESASGWQEVLENIKQRGVKEVGLFVFDGLTGLSEVVGKCFSNSARQHCMIHFSRSLSKRVRKTDRASFCNQVKQVFDPDNRNYTQQQGCDKLKEVLLEWSKKYPSLKGVIEKDDLELVFTYLNYDYRIRRMIYTTNWIERLNKSFRRTLKMRNALPNPKAALTLLGFTAMEMEQGTYSYPISNFKFNAKL